MADTLATLRSIKKRLDAAIAHAKSGSPEETAVRRHLIEVRDRFGKELGKLLEKESAEVGRRLTAASARLEKLNDEIAEVESTLEGLKDALAIAGKALDVVVDVVKLIATA